MERLKKIVNKLLFPHMALVLVLFPVSMALLICSMVFLGTESVLSYVSYMFSFYSLTIVCLRIPQIIEFIKKYKNSNKLLVRYQNDINFRINLSLYLSLVLNVAYSIFQLCLGLYHKSFWFISMSVYYVLLSLMRFYLVNHTKKNKPGEDLLIEYKRYNICGWVMLLMNLTITAIIFFIIYFDRTFYHHQITTIALAAYTFLTFSLSIYNFIKYRKFNSPVYSAAKSINLVAACVSMMTLTTTMLTTFGGEDVVEYKKLLLTMVGVVVSLFILAISIQIIIFTSKNLKKLKEPNNTELIDEIKEN
ncbi:MAG: hypothetical protein E7180_05280 [Erysipelotrichaceae bacterium]|nr:hypothetical protein [Erysipelotrichaceae bacterium]